MKELVEFEDELMASTPATRRCEKAARSAGQGWMRTHASDR